MRVKWPKGWTRVQVFQEVESDCPLCATLDVRQNDEAYSSTGLYQSDFKCKECLAEWSIRWLFGAEKDGVLCSLKDADKEVVRPACTLHLLRRRKPASAFAALPSKPL